METRVAAWPAKVPERATIRWGDVAWGVLKYALAIVVVLLTLTPIYWMITSSLKIDRDMFAYPPSILFAPHLVNYQDAIGDRQFLLYLRNSLVVSIGTTVVALVVASLAAHGLARYDFPGARLLAVAIMAARLVPGATMVMPYYVLFRFYGLTNTLPGLMLAFVGFSLPFASWLLYGFFLEIPSDIEDSGKIDGCSDFGVFWRIVLPLTRPGLAATAILLFLGSWNEFLYALVLTGPFTRTLPVYLASFIGERQLPWGRIFAAATVMVVPCLILILFVQRSLVRGLTAGAVKG